jgi:hypothetical protein
VFDVLIAPLTPFKSNETGNRLIETVDLREFRDAEAAKARLRTLINFVDATLLAAENKPTK